MRSISHSVQTQLSMSVWEASEGSSYVSVLVARVDLSDTCQFEKQHQCVSEEAHHLQEQKGELAVTKSKGNCTF